MYHAWFQPPLLEAVVWISSNLSKQPRNLPVHFQRLRHRAVFHRGTPAQQVQELKQLLVSQLTMSCAKPPDFLVVNPRSSQLAHWIPRNRLRRNCQITMLAPSFGRICFQNPTAGFTKLEDVESAWHSQFCKVFSQCRPRWQRSTSKVWTLEDAKHYTKLELKKKTISHMNSMLDL